MSKSLLSKYLSSGPLYSIEDEMAVAILQLCFDYEERDFDPNCSMPIYSYKIMVFGCSKATVESLMSQCNLGRDFHCTYHNFVLHIKKPPNKSNAHTISPIYHVPTHDYEEMMTSCTKILSYLTQMGYKVMSSSVNTSTYSGFVAKLNEWTLQRVNN